MDWTYTMYMVCLFLGVIYAVVSAVMSGVFGGGDHHDVGGHDAGGAHIDPGTHAAGAAVDTGDGMVHFSPLSPVVIAMFVTTFGGVGQICLRVFKIESALVHVPISMVSGLVVGAIVFVAFYKIVGSVQGTSQPTEKEIIGLKAEVLTSIPSEGLGEIAYNVRGMRYNVPAKSEDRKMIPAATSVTIERVAGNIYFVREHRPETDAL